jgi:hypothetical protein
MDRRTHDVDLPTPGRFVREPGAAPSALGGLAAGMGNAAFAQVVAREARGAEALPPGAEEAIAADVDFIVAKLQEELLTAAEEQQIVDRLERWAGADGAAGGGATPQLDRMLLRLKTRVFTRSTASSFWIEQHVNAFDELWRELEDDRGARFAAIVARSARQAASGPASGPAENFWATMGKQEAMGGLGIVKGMVMGATGAVDSGAGAITSLLKTAGVDAADPPKVAEWFGKQYDYMGRQAFGGEWDQGLIGGFSAGDIGTAGGKGIWQLVMIGAGNQMSAASGGSAILPAGEAAKSAQTALSALGIVGGLGGVADAGTGIARDIERLQDQGDITVEAVLADAQFQEHVFALASSVFSLLARSETADQKRTTAIVTALLESAGASTHIHRMFEIRRSNLTADQKQAAYKETIEKLIERLFAAAGAMGGAHDQGAFERKPEPPAQPGANPATGQPVEGLPQAQVPPEPQAVVQAEVAASDGAPAEHDRHAPIELGPEPEGPMELTGPLPDETAPPRADAIDIGDTKGDPDMKPMDRPDEQNYVQYGDLDGKKINKHKEHRNAGATIVPPPGGGTVQHGDRLYTFDASGKLIRAETSKVGPGYRDAAFYKNAPGTGKAAGYDYGHLLGVQFGNLDAATGRNAGVPMASTINQGGGAWHAAESRIAANLEQVGSAPYRLVGEATDFKGSVPGKVRLRLEVGPPNGHLSVDSGWIPNVHQPPAKTGS